MSGQGRSGRGNSGRGGCGGCGGQGLGKNRGTAELVSKFNPFAQSNGKKYALYSTVVAKLKTQVLKEMDDAMDIINSIKEEKLIDLASKKPSRRRSSKTDAEEKEIENQDLYDEYKDELKTFGKRIRNFEKNKLKTRALIIDEFCTNIMVDKLKEDPEYDEWYMTDFTKLLTKILEVMHQSNDAVNPYWSLTEAMSRLVNIKQQTNETIYAYKDRILHESNIVSAKIGTDFAEQFVESTNEYKKASDQSDIDTMPSLKTDAYGTFVATCYLRGCDREPYQSLIDDLTDGNIQNVEPVPVGSNGGAFIMRQEANVINYGRVKFKEGLLANILGLCNVVKKFRVQFDSKYANAFFVHTPMGVLKFECNARGLYLYKPRQVKYNKNENLLLKKMNNEAYCGKKCPPLANQAHVQTVKKNKEGFTARQLKSAAEARKFYHAVFAPSKRALKSVMRQGLIENVPVTTEDISIADAVYGPDVSTLKGRSTRPNLEQVKDNWVEIPPEITRHNRSIELAIYLMYINKCIFMTSIDKSVRFRGVVPLQNRTKENLYDALAKVCTKYQRADFVVHIIHCDGEFKHLMTEVEWKLKAYINYSAPDEHVPEAERNIRFLKERFQIAYYRMPYKIVPAVMIIYLAMQVCHTANWFAAKGGLSRIYLPFMILEEKKIDYKKHIPCEYGAFVEANNFTSNTNVQRTIIYLRPASNLQTGYEVLSLQTKEVVTQQKVTKVPISKQVIDIVEGWGRDEGFTSLKFYDQNKRDTNNWVVVHNADQIAGVDDQYIVEIDLYWNEEIEDDAQLTGVDKINDDEVNDLLQDQR